MAPQTIAEALAGLTQRAAHEQAMREALVAGMAVGSGGIVGLLLAEAGAARVATVLMVLVAVTAGTVWWWRWRQHRAAGLKRVAALADELVPELGTASRSALELEAWLTQPHEEFSRDLASLHVQQTAQRLTVLALASRLGVMQAPKRRRLVYGLVAVAVTAVVCFLGLATGRARLAALLLHPEGAFLVDAPLVGDIGLIYRYPAYTGLPPHNVAGGDGSLSAVVGTEVALRATADRAIEAAFVRVVDLEDRLLVELPLAVQGRSVSGTLSLLRDARYRFALVDDSGDRVEERLSRPIQALPDALPEVALEQPATDLELKDSDTIKVVWRARDDFGIGEVALVLNREGATTPERQVLVPPQTAQTQRDGATELSMASLGLAPGSGLSFFVEASDNDTLNGPKRGVSPTRRISSFSAKREHEKLLERERAVVDALVDWLSVDLTTPFPGRSSAERDRAPSLIASIERLAKELEALVAALANDALTAPPVRTAFENLRTFVREAAFAREALMRQLAALPNGGGAGTALQRQQVDKLERHIIYFDDLLALQRIEELKATAKDLLAAQHDLQALMQKYRETQDPALKTMLTQQIKELRQKMMALLARMASLKQSLPGEYQNLESGTMLKLDDQLQRLEKLLNDGDLDAAAAELEQLANMVEKMVNSIDQAEDEFGGERYAELRKKLADFAQEFGKLESEQQALAKRAQELAQSYRKRAVAQAGKSVDALAQRALKLVAEAQSELEKLAGLPSSFATLERAMVEARERLVDLDALLRASDFAASREVAQTAEENTQTVRDLTLQFSQWQRGKADIDMKQAELASDKANERVRQVVELLDRLFPDASEVMSKAEREEMRRLTKKQEELRKDAQALGQKMQGMANEVPVFGEEAQAPLQQAEGEMGNAIDSMQAGELPGAAEHKKRAADGLAKLRQALEQASKQGGGKGMPLPIGMGQGQSGSGNSQQNNEPVEIPQADKNRADPRFRKELLEAAKQKAPEHYEEAVRKYYEELVR